MINIFHPDIPTQPVYHRQYHQQIQQPQFNFEELKKKIWEWQWPVTMKRKWTYNQSDYEVYGIPITGDLEADLASMEDWTNTTRSIADLVELFDEGKEFIIRDPKHAERIFDIINEYTSFVAYKFNTSINLTFYKLEENSSAVIVLNDVIKMQNLANRLFPVAVELSPQDQTDYSGLFGFLQEAADLNGFTPLNFDPYQRYGLTKQQIRDTRNQDPNGNFKALDIEQKFDPHAFNSIRKVI